MSLGQPRAGPVRTWSRPPAAPSASMLPSPTPRAYVSIARSHGCTDALVGGHRPSPSGLEGTARRPRHARRSDPVPPEEVHDAEGYVPQRRRRRWPPDGIGAGSRSAWRAHHAVAEALRSGTGPCGFVPRLRVPPCLLGRDRSVPATRHCVLPWSAARPETEPPRRSRENSSTVTPIAVMNAFMLCLPILHKLDV